MHTPSNITRILIISAVGLLVLLTGSIHAENFVLGELVLKPAPGASIEDINAAHGTTVAQHLVQLDIYLLNALPEWGLEALATEIEDRADVEFCHPNYRVEPLQSVQGSLPVSDVSGGETYTNQQAARSLKVSLAHAYSTGANVKIAIIDGGIDYTHPVFDGTAISGYDYVDDDPDAFDELGGDNSGHGTFVAGIVKLVAPDAEILAYRACDPSGEGNGYVVTEAIIQAVADGCRVINLSLVMMAEHEAMRDAIAYARGAGCLVVAAAGNGHSESTTYPASDMNTLAVAAIDTVGALSDFSNYGVHVDVCAPGTDVYAPYTDGIYAWWSGTSFATPFVTAQAALILAAYPDLDQPALVEAIKAAARNIDSWNPELIGKIGTGLTDPFASLLLIRGTEAAVQIATVSGVDAGQPVDIPIELVGVSTATGGLIGFDLLVDYDSRLLSLSDVFQGEMLAECDWEYFQHRTDSGEVRVTAVADIASAPGLHSCSADRPGELARLRFTVDPTGWMACTRTPLRFLWNDCGDNACVGAADPSSLLISNDVYENNLPITQDTTFPGYSGAPDECLDGGGVTSRAIDFFHGGIEFSCDTPDENVLVVYPTSYDPTIGPDDSLYGAFSVWEQHGRSIDFDFSSSTGLVDLSDLTLVLSTPDSIFFSVSAAGLALGTYYDTIVVTTIEPAVNSPAYIPVSLTVQEEPVPQDSAWVWPDTLTFQAAFGTDPILSSCVLIGSSGKSRPYYTGLVGYPVFVSDYAHDGWTNDTTCVSVNPSGLPPGVYYNHIMYIVDSIEENPELVIELVVEGDTILPTLATLQVGTIAGAEAGQAIEIPIEVTSVAPGMELSAFDLTVDFDQYLLTLYEVEQGAWLTDCGWEYFTFRTDGGLVRLIGLAETSGNPGTPDCFVTGAGELAILRFVVEPDLWAPCLNTPIRFLWQECANNALVSNSYPWSMLISKDVYQDGQQLDPDTIFPNYTGATNECLDPGGVNIRAVDFIHGQVEFACPPGEQNVLVVAPTAYTAQVLSGDTLADSVFVRELHDSTIAFDITGTTGLVRLQLPFRTLTTPDSVQFDIPTAGLAPGTYYDTLVISALDQAVNSPVRVPVAISVQPGPDPGGDSISVWPDTLFFTATTGTDQLMNGCVFLASSVDSLFYEGVVVQDTFIPVHVFISDFDSVGITNDTVCVTVNPGGLEPGFYYNHIRYNIAGSNTGTELVVFLTIEDSGGGSDSAFVLWDTLYLSMTPYDSTVMVDCARVISTNAPAAYTIQPVGELAFTTLLSDSGVTNDSFCYELSAGYLDTGYYADTLEIRVGGVDNNPLLHIISLTVTTDSGAVAWATPDTLYFTAEFGTEPYPFDHVSLFSNRGAVPYGAYILAGSDEWTFSEFPDEGSGKSGFTNDTIMVSVANTVMPPGTYYDLLRFDVEGSQPVFVSLVLTIEGEWDPQACCTGFRGNIDGDPEELVDIGDLTAFVDNLFISFMPMACPGEANIDGDAMLQTDLGDLTLLIDYLFIGSWLLPDCDAGPLYKPYRSELQEVTVSWEIDAGVTTIGLQSAEDIRALRLELSGEGGGQPVSLLDDRLELFSGDDDGTLVVGIVDLEGSAMIPAKVGPIVRLDGEYLLVGATASDRNHNSLQLAVTNSPAVMLPDDYLLEQNYPNPFNPVTQINFHLPEASATRLEVFNVMGQKAVTLIDRYLEAGEHTVTFDGSQSASGVYFYQLEAGDFVDTKKMILLK